jgi:hypothetical protein
MAMQGIASAVGKKLLFQGILAAVIFAIALEHSSL